MTRAAVDTLLYLLDESFSGDDEHSLMANLRSVRTADWLWKPQEGHRSIRRIAEHAGAAYWAYEDHLFGQKAGAFEHHAANAPSVREPDAMAETVAWITRGFGRFRAGVDALEDDALSRPSQTHYGPVKETRFIIGVMIGHAIYHAGEINHIRALHHGDDRWFPDPPAAP